MNKSIGTEYRRKLALVSLAAKGIITPIIAMESLAISRQEAGRLLSRWHQQGWIKRLKRGVYIPIAVEDITGEETIEDVWLLANHLFSPGYIGGFSAIKYWDFSEQIFETTAFFTTKAVKDRQPIIGSTRFYLKTVAPYKLFGVKPVWHDNKKILVSDATKTIVDLFDDPKIIGGMSIVKDVFLAYKESEYFDMDLLVQYSQKIRNKTVIKRLGYLMEYLELSDFIEKYDLTAQISKGYSLFDPSVKNVTIVRKWNLKIPASWKK